MEATITYLLAGLFLIGFLVVIHEAGHMVFAKLFGVGVPVFSVGMGPRLIGIHYKGTDYRISALPIGGYVQMAGADPFGEEDRSLFVDEDEDFMRKPVWQRLIIMAAGPGVNLALPFVVFTLLLMAGEPNTSSIVGAVLPGTAAQTAGLLVDDHLLSVDGVPTEIWEDVKVALDEHLVTGGPVDLRIDRDGAEQTVTLPATALVANAEGRADIQGLGLMPAYLEPFVGIDASASPAGVSGLENGDLIVTVDGEDVDRWDDMIAALDGDQHLLGVKRASDDEVEELEITLEANPEWVPSPAHYANRWGLGPAMLYVGNVEEDGPADRAGVKRLDRIVRADGKDVLTFTHFIEILAFTTQNSDEPRPVALELLREGEPLSLQLTPELRVVSGEAYSRPIIGVRSTVYRFRPVATTSKRYGPVAAFRKGAGQSLEVIGYTVAILGNIFTGQSDPKDNIGGPVAIFQVAGQSLDAGLFTYARVIGMLSISIGILNLLPVPVLDGGQILFYAVEGIRGRPLSLELRERFQMVGVVGLVILMLLVTVNDISRWIGG